MNIKPIPQRQPKPPIACAWGDCENTVERGQEYSFIITFATRGPDGRAGAFQCPDADEIAAGNYDAQHFCCSAECAAKCAHACIDEHLVPRHQDHIASLAAHDAALAAEQAAMEAYRQQRNNPFAADGSAPAPTPHPSSDASKTGTPVTQVQADDSLAQPATPPRWIDPAALALVAAANAEAAAQEPVPAADAAPGPDMSEDVTQVVQQTEEPDAAVAPPPAAEPEPVQEAMPPDDGPPTLLAIPTVPQAPVDNLVHHGPPPDPVPIPNATGEARAMPAAANGVTMDASEQQTPVTHDTESEASSGVPASSDEIIPEADTHDTDAAGPSSDGATPGGSAAVLTTADGSGGPADASPAAEGVWGGSTDGAVADRPGSGDDLPEATGTEPTAAADGTASEPVVAEDAPVQDATPEVA
jgi:hypothetical protein